MKHKKINMELAFQIISFIRILLIAYLIGLLVITFGARKMEVVGSSMYPTLKDKEDVFINVAASYMSELHRFDVVVVEHEETKEEWVKRIIGLPGETISFHKGELYVDGKHYDQTFLDASHVVEVMKKKNLAYFTQDYTSRQLGQDEYLLVGDNRNESFDSRSESVGPFKRNQIKAKGIFVFNPIQNMRYVNNGG